MKRADPNLQELIDLLDERYARAKGDTARAFASLSKAESEAIDDEIEKCVNSIRYYLGNYHVIKSKSEGLITMATLRGPQEAFLELVEEQIASTGRCKAVCLKARQEGLSSLSEGLAFRKTIFTPACNTLIVAQDVPQSSYLLDMSRLAYDSLPWWMRPQSRYEARGKYMEFDQKDRDQRQVSPGLRSAIYVEAANRLTGVAVGKAIRCVHCSELSSWIDSSVLSEQIFPAMEGASDILAIMESTARGRDGFWYPLWRECMDGKLGEWVPIFLGAYRMKEYSIPVPAGIEFTLTPEEEGIRRRVRDDDGTEVPDSHFYWRRKKSEEFAGVQGDDSKLGQEYPESWLEAFQATGVCAFSKKRLQQILDTTCAKPLLVGEISLRDGRTPIPNLRPLAKGEKVPLAETNGARLRVWEEPEEEEAYFVGADVAGGTEGGDFSCVQVIKIGRGPEPDEQVAEWRGWETPTTFAYIVAALGMWYNECQVAVEVNGIGNVTNAELTRVIEYENVYQYKRFDKIKNFITDWLGWFTDHKTRDMIIAKMNEAVRDSSIVIRSEDLIEEMFDFGNDGYGKFEAQSGNDDRVMGMMIARFCAHDSDYGLRAASAPRDRGRRQGRFLVRTGKCNVVGALVTWVEGDHFDPEWGTGTAFMIDGKMAKVAGTVTPNKLSLDKPIGLKPNIDFIAYHPRKDFANTSFSPVFDRPGDVAGRLVEQEGVPPEWAQEVAVYVGLDSLPNSQSEDDAWRCL